MHPVWAASRLSLASLSITTLDDAPSNTPSMHWSSEIHLLSPLYISHMSDMYDIQFGTDYFI
jgi:hypothetical protein